MCAALTEVIQAAEDSAAGGDPVGALKHFRAAIELAEGTAKRK
jgi:hypothetical protein